jgi:hypothetical protein
MEAIMSNHGAAAIEIGTVIAILAGMAIAKQRLPVTQPLNREQPLLSTAESQRLSDRQQVNRYFLQNWRDRPTRPNFDWRDHSAGVSQRQATPLGAAADIAFLS